MGAAEALLRAGQEHRRTENSQVAPLAYSFFGEEYLGAAHGLIGIVYVLMHTPVSEARDVRAAVDFVVDQQMQSGNFPAVLGDDSDDLVHWCHGAPGAVFLLCCAYDRWSEERHLRAALLA